jgi:hypothetical protein
MPDLDPGENPAQAFGPMKVSSLATDARRATEMFRAFIRRHSTPTLLTGPREPIHLV